jgi:hypothetical protein
MEVITIAQAKQLLRLDADYTLEDELIKDMIDCSVEWCEKYTGLTFGLKSLRFYGTKCRHEIPYGPVWDITNVKDVNGNNVEYSRHGFQYPTLTFHGSRDVVVEYVAGFNTGLPANLKSAVKMMVATLYEYRESYTIGDRGMTLIELPIGITDLLRPHSRSGGLFI